MANKRMYYAVYAAGFSPLGVNNFTKVHGLQQIGITTRFNLEQVFEIGMISVYDNVENIPDIEVTMEKVLDGHPMLWHLGTEGATSATLGGRSNIKTQIAVSYFTDTQDAASGTPLRQVVMSGMFPSSFTVTLPTEGNASESVSFVGNNKIWKSSSFTFNGGFTTTDAPLHASGVLRRQHVIMGSAGCKFPTDIPNISASGTNEFDTNGTDFKAHIVSARASTNLGRTPLFELGRRGPYHRVADFPVEVRSDIEVYCQQGDNVTALEDAISNLSNQEIVLKTTDGMIVDLGTKNKLSNVTETGGNAGARGGNRTVTYSYVNYNDLTCTHPEDPSGL